MNDERKPSGFLKRLFLNIPSVLNVIAAALIFAMVISMIIFIIRSSGIFSDLCSGRYRICALPGGRRGVHAGLI
ncbi:MAG: hypothetical protein ACLTCB_01510 [Merdibacter sp.]